MNEKDIQSDIWKNLGGQYADMYWNFDQKRGQWLVEYFKDRDINSILEVGCNSGRNLRYVYDNIPIGRISGVEISPDAAQMARDKIPGATIHTANLHDIVVEKHDVVFTGGVLLHIPGEDVVAVINKCISTASKYVVHMEPTGNGKVKYKDREGNRVLRCFHDLNKIYTDLGYGDKIDIRHRDNSKKHIYGPEYFMAIDVSGKQ